MRVETPEPDQSTESKTKTLFTDHETGLEKGLAGLFQIKNLQKIEKDSKNLETSF